MFGIGRYTEISHKFKKYFGIDLCYLLELKTSFKKQILKLSEPKFINYLKRKNPEINSENYLNFIYDNYHESIYKLILILLNKNIDNDE